MKVLCLIDYDKKLKAYFRSQLDEKITVMFSSKDKLNKIRNYEGFDCLIGHRIDKSDLYKFNNLKYYIIPFAGIPEKDKNNLKDFEDITLINSHYNSLFVAEHAWALLLSLMKKIIPAHNGLKEGDWTYRYERNLSGILYGKNILIAGYGAIGKKIKNFANSFNMNVFAVKKHKSNQMFLYETNKMKYILPEINILISALPFTNETLHFISYKEFELLDKGVFLVNVGRGDVINQRALYHYLRRKKIAGAAIDTWWNYPKYKEARKNTFPADYNFDEFENFIFSPHRASHVEKKEFFRIDDLVKIISNLNNGKIINKVNKKNGY